MTKYRQTIVDLEKHQAPSMLSEGIAGACFALCLIVLLFI